MKFVFTNKAYKQFLKFPVSIQTFLSHKIKAISISGSGDFKTVVNISPATHRLRIGNYRLLLMKEGNDFIVLKIGHRKNIYSI